MFWLGKKDVPEACGPTAVFVTKANNTHRPISEGFFYIGGKSGTTMAFKRRPRDPAVLWLPANLRHKADQCTSPQMHGRYVKVGHYHTTCRESIVKLKAGYLRARRYHQVLFLFDANLLQQQIDENGWALVSINKVIGKSRKANRQWIQYIINRILN